MRLSYVNNLVPYHDNNSTAINHCVHVHAAIGVVNSSRMPFITQEKVSAGDIMIYYTLFVRRAALNNFAQQLLGLCNDSGSGKEKND